MDFSTVKYGNSVVLTSCVRFTSGPFSHDLLGVESDWVTADHHPTDSLTIMVEIYANS